VEGGGEALTLTICDEPELRLAATIRHLQVEDHKGIGKMVELAWYRLADLGVEPTGPPIVIFRWGDGDGTHLVEVGYAVPEAFEGDDLLRVRTYPAAPAATVEHHGSYDTLPATSQRFVATVLGQGLRFAQPIRMELIKYYVLARIVWPLAAAP
jgi:hypothetical protein